VTFYLLAVGRVKSAALRDACELLQSRIRRYLKLEVREVREARRPAADAERARRLEGAALLRAAPAAGRLIALARAGRSHTSEEFARRVAGWQRDARDVALVVGGAYGLDGAVLSRAELTLSLSRMTLPHDLARLVVLEQLYRACTILRGEPYHKGRAT
jgi:23S rRNA (pseudouridine1915-N3)-methyltransferase